MRVVLDTNVVVSALIWGGKPLSLLHAALEGDLQLFTSPTLQAVLSREHLAIRLADNRSSVERALAAYSGL